MLTRLLGPLALVLLFLCAGVSEAGLILIVVGDHSLLPNTAGQQVLINVQGEEGNEFVQGLNLNMQIGDGTAGPVFQDVNIVDGTIFDGNHNLPVHVADQPWVQVWTVTTATGSVLANGLLAALTIATTGIDSGTWALTLKDDASVPPWSTTFPGNNPPSNEFIPSITNGSLQIAGVPAPSTFALSLGDLLSGGLAWLYRPYVAVVS